MKFGQLIEYNVISIFLQKSCRKSGRETSSRPLFAFKKALHKVKASGQHPSFKIYLGRPPLRHTIKTNCIIFQTVDPETYSILIFYKRVWD